MACKMFVCGTLIALMYRCGSQPRPAGILMTMITAGGSSSLPAEIAPIAYLISCLQLNPDSYRGTVYAQAVDGSCSSPVLFQAGGGGWEDSV